MADTAVALDATGPAAYLDIATLVATAQAQGCDAVHPGYGFLSERADFASACEAAGITFIGPTPEQLGLFGDKAQARALAAAHGVPLLPGTEAATLEEIQAFFAEQRARNPHCGVMLKAVAGGGGRGMRAVMDPAELPEAYARCSAEAQAAFGVGAVYAERLIARARHLEIQILGDGRQVMALGERECTLQRRFQKLVEVAPSPNLPNALRERLIHHALALTEACAYRSLGTVEFLVDEASADLPLVFIEANPRLQVEHTVTEAVTGIDLVATQIQPSPPATLAGRNWVWTRTAHRSPRMALRCNGASTAKPWIRPATTRPASGLITRCEFAQGPGIRIDTQARAGFQPSPHYDTLQAKLIVHHNSPHWADVLRRSQRALAECRIDGLATNLPLAACPGRATRRCCKTSIHTRWLEEAWPVAAG